MMHAPAKTKSIEELTQDLDEAKVELEEQNEFGDLEDRLEAAQRVADCERALQIKLLEAAGQQRLF